MQRWTSLSSIMKFVCHDCHVSHHWANRSEWVDDIAVWRTAGMHSLHVLHEGSASVKICGYMALALMWHTSVRTGSGCHSVIYIDPKYQSPLLMFCLVLIWSPKASDLDILGNAASWNSMSMHSWWYIPIDVDAKWPSIRWMHTCTTWKHSEITIHNPSWAPFPEWRYSSNQLELIKGAPFGATSLECTVSSSVCRICM